MAPHTTAHWPTELYLPSPIVERDNRENWTKAGATDTYARATAEVERRLARYRPIETDDRRGRRAERIIRSGLTAQTELPFVPPAPAPSPTKRPAAAGAGTRVGAAERRFAVARVVLTHASMG